MTRAAIRSALATVVATSMLAVTAPAQALLASCTVSNSTLSFGSYNPIAASPSTATATVTVTCTGIGLLVSYTVLLSGGGSGNTASRRMNAGASTLPYNLYTSASYTTVWDNSTGVSGGFLIGLGGTAFSHTVYGRILAQQPAAAGNYVDSLIITVNY